MRRVSIFVVCATSVVVALFVVVPNTWAAPTGAVLISEIMWDGVEYLELLNVTDTPVELDGWSLTRQQSGKGTPTIMQFDAGDVIAPGAYFLIEKNESATTVVADKVASALTLVNSGEFVQLLDDAGQVVDRANWFGSWFAGQNTATGVAMERAVGFDDGAYASSWQTSSGVGGGRSGTPGVANSEGVVNVSPDALVDPSSVSVFVGDSVVLSGEDSTDPDGDVLTYSWTFGDGDDASGVQVAHTYAAAGVYTAMLVVSDGEFDAEDTAVVSVAARTYSDAVVVNEFLPNPLGSDTAGEFIELKNIGGDSVDLSGWQLDDVGDGGSAAYTILDGVVIGSGSVLSFSREETKLALNNGGDSVRLLSPDDVVRSSFGYDTAPEGQSYNRDGSGEYVVSTTVTEGAENVITSPAVSDEEGVDGVEEDSSDDEGSVAGASVKKVSLKNIRSEELGTIIETEGVVSVPPGVLGEKIVYLAGSGVQVYFYDEAYPPLSLGSTVQVRGQLSSYLDEARIKIADASDIVVVSDGDVPQPHVVSTGEIDEDFEGSLVTLSGDVVETSGSTFYVDDGSGAVKVFIKESTQIDKPAMQQGTVVTITGVVSQTKTGYRILPRFQEDVRLGRVAGLTSFPNTGVSVLGVAGSVFAAFAAAALGLCAREPLWGGLVS